MYRNYFYDRFFKLIYLRCRIRLRCFWFFRFNSYRLFLIHIYDWRWHNISSIRIFFHQQSVSCKISIGKVISRTGGWCAAITTNRIRDICVWFSTPRAVFGRVFPTIHDNGRRRLRYKVLSEEHHLLSQLGSSESMRRTIVSKQRFWVTVLSDGIPRILSTKRI